MNVPGLRMFGRKKVVERGASVVEFAILLPLLLLMLFGVGDFGRVLYWAITLSNAARAGAQYGSQDLDKPTDAEGIEQAAKSEAQNIGGIEVFSGQICKCPGDDNANCSVDCPEVGFGPPQVFVAVTTSTTFRTMVPYPGIPKTVPLSRTAILRLQ